MQDRTLTKHRTNFPVQAREMNDSQLPQIIDFSDFTTFVVSEDMFSGTFAIFKELLDQ
jgi:hypothetical protein